jgi:two-component system NarL family response regulator
MAPRLKSMLVDASEIFRVGFRTVMDRHRDDLTIAAELDRLDLAPIERVVPDLLFVDLDAPGAEPALVTGALRRVLPATRVIVLATRATAAKVQRLLAAGATGYIAKTQAVVDVLAALDRIVRGELGVSEGDSPPQAAATRALRCLSAREREVFDRVIWGASNKDVAAQLNISIKTVETHRGHINAKLGARSPADLVRVASLLGLLGQGRPPELG